MECFDVVVVGGGIAGASIAHELAEDRSVCLLEAERELAAHTTGHSAATWIAGYGPPRVRRLTAASKAFLDDPPLDVDGPVISPTACLYVASDESATAAAEAERLVAETGALRLTPGEAEAANPVLRAGVVTVAVLDPTACELDVHGLHQGYVRGLRARRGVVRRSAGLVGAERAGAGGPWRLATATGEDVLAGVVVDAAGAWGDVVGRLFGSRGVGLEPRRRTMFTSPTSAPLAGVPFTCDLDGGWYFKAEGDCVLASPEDAGPHEPGDPRPDELEVARTIEQVNDVTVLGLRSVRTAWAGLRTFAPGGDPVARWDPDVEGLFWLVGQGGYGIQVAPALAREAAQLVRG